MILYCNFYIFATQNLSLVNRIYGAFINSKRNKLKMPNTPQAKHFWLGETEPEIVTSSNHVHDKMLENVVTFVTPTIAMSVYNTAIVRANTAYGNRANGPEEVLEEENAFKALVVINLSLTKYVSDLAGGDVSIILKAGMEATFTETHKAVICGQANTPTGKSSPGGGVKLHTVKVAGADSYFWVIFTDVPVVGVIAGKMIKFPSCNGMVVIPAGRTTEDLTGFTGGIIKAGVYAVNPAGIGVMSGLFTLQTQA